LRHDLARDQLYLPPLVTHQPEVNSLGPRAGIAGQQLDALARRADADLAAELGRVSPDQRSDDPGQNPVGLWPAAGCASSAAAPGAPDSSPKRFTFSRAGKSEDE